jgi:hypothetical protein
MILNDIKVKKICKVFCMDNKVLDIFCDSKRTFINILQNPKIVINNKNSIPENAQFLCPF